MNKATVIRLAESLGLSTQDCKDIQARIDAGEDLQHIHDKLRQKAAGSPQHKVVTGARGK